MSRERRHRKPSQQASNQDQTSVQGDADLRHEVSREYEAYRAQAERFDPERWEAALEHKRRMPLPPDTAFLPDPRLLEELDASEAGVFAGDAEVKAEVRPDENPDPAASFGIVGMVAVDAEDTYVPGTVLIRFDPERLGTVARESLGVFRWDETAERYRLIPASGVGADGDYVWARITEPGRYAVIGLDVDPLVLRTVRALYGARDLLRLADPEQRHHLRDRICELILCAPDMYGLLEDPERLDALVYGGLEDGLPSPPPGWKPSPERPAGNICDHCFGLSLPEGWLPEFDLLPELGAHVHLWPEVVPGLGCRCDGWTSVGPSLWREGPGAHDIIAGCAIQVAVDPGDNARVYAAASDGGLWVLEDALAPSRRWRPLTDQNASLIVTAFAVAPADTRVIYLADGLRRVRRSVDRGEQWTSPPAMWGVGSVRRLLVDPLDPDRVVAATSTGLWASTNGGANWIQRRTGDITDAAMDPEDSAIFFIGVRHTGVQRSADGGLTWTTVLPWASATTPAWSFIRVAVGQQGTPQSRTVIAKLDQEVFVNRRGGLPPGTPGGGAWTSRGKVGGDGQFDWNHALAVSPGNDDLLFAGGKELYRTTDGGATWQEVAGFDPDDPHEDQHELAFDPTDPGRVYLANDGGIFRSEDGGATWVGLNAGLVTAQFFRVGIGGNRAVGNVYHSGIIASHNVGTQTWEGIEGHSWEFRKIHGDPKRPDIFYVFHGSFGRRRFPGTGTNDFIIEFGKFPPTALAVDTRAGSNTLLVGSHTPGRIMRALDGHLDAPTWTVEPGMGVGNEPIVGIALAPTQPGLAYAVSSSGRVLRKDDVNSSQAWVEVGQWPVGGVQSVAVNARHADRLYLITGDRVARSADGGATWVEVPGTGTATLPNSELHSLVAAPYDGRTLFVAADIGVFVTRNEGQHWYPFDVELPNAEVLQVLWAGSHLYAVTHGRGLWRRAPSRCW